MVIDVFTLEEPNLTSPDSRGMCIDDNNSACESPSNLVTFHYFADELRDIGI